MLEPLAILRKLSREVDQLIKEHSKLMADVTQLTADLASLQSAVADDQAAISSVQAYAQSQAAEILNLEQQLAMLQSQGGRANLDLSGLEASIAALKQQNQVLSAIVVPAPASGSGTDTGTTAGAAPTGATPAQS
jgi:chromosome segregation ATPase